MVYLLEHAYTPRFVERTLTTTTNQAMNSIIRQSLLPSIPNGKKFPYHREVDLQTVSLWTQYGITNPLPTPAYDYPIFGAMIRVDLTLDIRTLTIVDRPYDHPYVLAW